MSDSGSNLLVGLETLVGVYASLIPIMMLVFCRNILACDVSRTSSGTALLVGFEALSL